MSQKNLNTQETNKRRISFPVVESMSQAASMCGCPESMLKAAKRKGCKAFISGSRVDLGILIPYLFSMMAKGNELPDGFASWKEVLESEKAKREQIKRQQDEGAMMLTSDAETQAASAMALTFAELERRDRELPPALAGLPAVEIYKRMTADTETIRRNLKQKFQEVGK